MDSVRPTDTLANERTFLAYARTSLAFIGFGFVVARFSLFTREVAIVAHLRESAPISASFGTTMALAGVGCALYGAYRYIVTARALRAGANAPLPDEGAIAIAAVIVLIGLVITWTVFAIH